MNKAYLSSRRKIASAALLLLLSSMPSLSQNIEIKGRIINQDGSPVDAAIVTINVSGQNERQSLEFLLSDTTSTNGEFVVRFAEMAPDTEIVLADNDKISAIYPNPGGEFRGININAVQVGHYRIDIYNSIGGFVANVLNQELPPGNHHVRFNLPDGVASGIYFAKIAGGNQTSIVKFTLVAGSINAQGESGFSETQLISPDYVIKSAPISGGNARLVIPTKVDYDRTFKASIDLGDLRVQTVPAAITIKGKTTDVFGELIRVDDIEAFLTINGSTRTVKGNSDNSGKFSLVYTLNSSELKVGFSAKLDSIVYSSMYVPRQSFVLNRDFKDVDLGDVVLNKIRSSITISGKTTDVFGEGISVDDVALFLTVNGTKRQAVGSSDASGNFAVTYALDPSDAVSGFSASVDSTVYSGHNIPRQSFVLNKPFNNLSLGDVKLDNLVDVTFKFPGLVDTLNTPYSPDLRIIGKHDTWDAKAENGILMRQLPAGQYKIIINESDTVYGMKLGLIEVRGNNLELRLPVVDKVNFTPLEKEWYETMFIKGCVHDNKGYIMTHQPKFYINSSNLPEEKKHWPLMLESWIKGNFARDLDGFLVNPEVEIGTNPPEYGTDRVHVIQFFQFPNPQTGTASTGVLTNNKGEIYYSRSSFHVGPELSEHDFEALFGHELFTGLNNAGAFSYTSTGIKSVINLGPEVIYYFFRDLQSWDQKSWKALKYLGPGHKKGFEQRDFSSEITIGPSRSYSVN